VLVVANAHLHEQQLHGRLRTSLGVLGLGRFHAGGDGRHRRVLWIGGSDAEVEAGVRRSGGGGGGRERCRPWFGRVEEAAGEGCC
jgi:hypothetical protein